MNRNANKFIKKKNVVEMYVRNTMSEKNVNVL